VVGLTNRWVVLGLMFLIGLTLPMQFQTVPALAPFLVAETGLNYTDIGVLTGVFMFPGVFLALPDGLLAARIGDKWTLITGLSVMLGSALFFAATDSYGLMFFSRLLAGSGAVFITILLPKVVTDWFVDKEIATALATIASSFGLGVGLAMAALPYVADLTSWSTAVVANTAVAAGDLAASHHVSGPRSRPWRDQKTAQAVAAQPTRVRTISTRWNRTRIVQHRLRHIHELSADAPDQPGHARDRGRAVDQPRRRGLRGLRTAGRRAIRPDGKTQLFHSRRRAGHGIDVRPRALYCAGSVVGSVVRTSARRLYRRHHGIAFPGPAPRKPQ
jgi:hypothetical protein